MFFYDDESENFEHFQYINFEADFVENDNFFSINWSTVF